MLSSWFSTSKDLFKSHLSGMAFVLGLAAVISSFVLATGIKSIRDKDVISTTGSAERIVTSDSAKLRFSITKTGSRYAYGDTARAIQSEVEIVKKYLASHGLVSDDVTVNPLSNSVICASPQQESYSESGKQCTGEYSVSLSQEVVIDSSDVEKIKQLSLTSISDLSSKGVEIGKITTEYYYTKLADLRVELLSEAAKNAKERAEAIAASTANKVGAVRDASQGVFQVTAKNSTDVNDYGLYDTSTVEKKVTAVVRASFSVK